MALLLKHSKVVSSSPVVEQSPYQQFTRFSTKEEHKGSLTEALVDLIPYKPMDLLD